MTTQRDKKLELIAQLLAKAESTTPEEAEALTASAERLMLRYGIEQAMIDAERGKHGQRQEQIVERRMRFTGQYALALREMAVGVVFAFGTVRSLQATWGGGHTVWVVGFESDADRCVQLIQSLARQMATARAAWWVGAAERFARGDLFKYDRAKARIHYSMGFGRGAAARIRDARRTAESEAGEGAALAVIDRGEAVQAAIDTQGLRRARGYDPAVTAATAAGWRDGQESDTGTPQLAGRLALERRV